jgi:hypothetical protein
MNRSHLLAALIGMTLLAGCSGRSGGAPAVRQKAEAEAEAASMPTQEERTFKPIAAVSNLSPGAAGFIAQQIAGKANADGKPIDTNASVMTADALILNAQSYSAETLQSVQAALKERKRVIIDSDGTPEGRKAVKAALAQVLGGSSVEADGAVVTVYNADSYGITPLENLQASAGEAGANQSGNTPANVLGLN